jgi:hypothetical protein
LFACQPRCAIGIRQPSLAKANDSAQTRAAKQGQGKAVAEIVNLKRVKKARARTEAERRAAGNRVRHGLTKAAKKTLELERRRQAERQVGAKLDDGGNEQ